MMSSTELVIVILATYILLPCCLCACNSLLTRLTAVGQYCEDYGVIIPWAVSFHECKWLCIQKPTCTATNYNTSENICSLLSTPCPQASSDTLMVYTMFSDNYHIPRDLCLEWVDYIPGMPTDNRWALTKVGGDDKQRVVARMTYNGDIYPAHMFPFQSKCFGTDGVVSFKSSQGYTCQLLRVKDGCTIGFLSFTAGDIIPPNVVGLRSLFGGMVRYIAIVGPTTDKFIVGHYTDGTPGAVIWYAGVKEVSEMLLLLII